MNLLVARYRALDFVVFFTHPNRSSLSVQLKDNIMTLIIAFLLLILLESFWWWYVLVLCAWIARCIYQIYVLAVIQK